MQANDSGLASYVAGQIDRSLSWKVRQMGLSSWGLRYITSEFISLHKQLKLVIYWVCHVDLFRIDENLDMKRELANLQTDKFWKKFFWIPPSSTHNKNLPNWKIKKIKIKR